MSAHPMKKGARLFAPGSGRLPLAYFYAGRPGQKLRPWYVVAGELARDREPSPIRRSRRDSPELRRIRAIGRSRADAEQLERRNSAAATVTSWRPTRKHPGARNPTGSTYVAELIEMIDRDIAAGREPLA